MNLPRRFLGTPGVCCAASVRLLFILALFALLAGVALDGAEARPPELKDISEASPPPAAMAASIAAGPGETSLYFENFEGPGHGWTLIRTPPVPPVYWNWVAGTEIAKTDFEAPMFSVAPLPQAGFGAWQSADGLRVAVTDEIAYAGTQALKIDRNDPTGDAGFMGAYRGVDLEAAGQMVTVSMAVNLSPASKSSFWNPLHVGLKDNTSVDINIDPAGQFHLVYPGVSPIDINTGAYITRGQWSVLALDIDFRTRSVVFRRNGTAIATMTFPGTNTYVQYVSLSGWEPNTDDVGYFDDLIVSVAGTWWCGTDDPCLLATPPGYGNSWDQTLEHALGPVPANETLDLVHWYDTEPNFDYCNIEWSADGGITWSLLDRFDGNSQGFVETNVDMSAHVGESGILRLHFTSDSGWSDEDALHVTNGAWRVARVSLGTEAYDFSGSDHGWVAGALPVPPTWTEYRLESDPYCDAAVGDCSADFGQSWVAYDPQTNMVPLYTGSGIVEAGIESPAIPLPPDYDALLLDYSTYWNLPLADQLFTQWRIVSVDANGCRTIRSNNYNYYGTVGWQCTRPQRWVITHLIAPGAVAIHVQLVLRDFHNVYSFPWSGNHTEGVYFDNVHVIAVNTSAPGIQVPDYCAPPHPDFVAVSGQLSSDCGVPLSGVTVDLNHPDGEMLTTTTDAAGMFAFADVPYSTDEAVVAIVAPLGFDATTPPEGQVLLTLDQDRETSFALMCHDPQGDARTIGYWKHQANVYLNDRGNAQETVEDISTNYPNAIFSHFHENQLNSIAVEGVTYMDTGGGPGPLSLQVIHNTLTVNRDGTMLDRAKQQYLGFLLNVASGKLMTYTVVSEDGATASQALQQVAVFINDGDPSNDEAAKTIADEINNARMLAVGVIDLNIEYIAYRAGLGGVNFRAGPSPFRGGTMIQFRSEKPGPARADVFSASGRLVRTLYDSPAAMGIVELRWNGRDGQGRQVASGVYYVRLRLADKTFQKAVVFLR